MKIVLAPILFLLITITISAFVAYKADRNERQAVRQFLPEGGRALMIGGVQVHAVEMGAGPDLVLIHGSSGNTRDFTFSLAEKLAQRYRVIVFDRPGHGYTHRINETGATIRQQADLLATAARQMGAEKPIVLGHSYGGAVALAWAVNHPDALAGLVLVGAPSQPWTTPLDRHYRLLSHPVIGPPLATLITAFVGNARVEQALEGIFAPNPVPEGYAEHVGPGLTLRRSSQLANARQRANLLAEITALQPLYSQITVPVEIVHGAADTTVGLKIHAEPLARQIPQARLTRLEGIGHMPHHVAPQEVIAAIARATP